MAYSVTDEQIFGAALEVIAQKGYAGASTREIAATAGINEVTLFRRFGSKQQLLFSAVEKEAEGLEAEAIRYTGDLETDLLHIAEFYRDLMMQRGHVVVMLMSELSRQPELREIMQVPFSILLRAAAVIERYQAEGVLIKEPPVKAFVSIMGPLLLSQVVHYAISDAEGLIFEPEEMVARFLHGRLVR